MEEPRDGGNGLSKEVMLGERWWRTEFRRSCYGYKSVSVCIIFLSRVPQCRIK